MNKTVKTLVLFTIGCLLFYSSVAQLRLPGNNAVANDIRKVIEDYPNRFSNLAGELVSENGQSAEYQCNFKVNGAEESTITRYVSKEELCTWQAVMMTTETFEKAKQKFKTLFSQLNNLPVDLGAGKNFHLRGTYTAPEEARKFTAVVFSLENSHDKLKKLRVEVSMQFQAPVEWKVSLQVYDKEREDDERGKTVDQ